MRIQFAIGVIVLCLAAPSGAAAEPTWIGKLVTVSTAGAACEDFIAVGTGTSVFRPKLTAADPNTALSYVNRRSAGIIVATDSASRFDGKGKITSYGILPNSTLRTASGTFTFVTSPPAASINSKTKFITLNGDIKNFGGTSGCSAKVSAAYSLYE